jgi:SAM-dependent methyltransferase
MTDKYFSGKVLYGDDFTKEQIQQWYNEETEAYADLGSKDEENYSYGYHPLNTLHGFSYLPANKRFENAMGMGAAWGHEFYPVIDRIDNLHMIEPSDNLLSDKIAHLKPIYTKPTVEGVITYPDNFFDLITCFGTLHHIPNALFVLKELYRVTKPGGYLLIREPVISMGDWRQPRKGLTRNERGIPLNLFRQTFKELNAEIVNEALCFSMTAFFQRGWSKLFKRPVYTYPAYIWFDKWFSKALSGNLHYHATKKLERIAPQSVFYVVKKP